MIVRSWAARETVATPVTASSVRRRALIGVAPALAAMAVWLVTAATASAFSAHGSVEQVYVTGLAPGAQMSLLGKKGETVSTQTADSLGGLLFRNVAPGKLYRVRLSSSSEESGPITVHTQSRRRGTKAPTNSRSRAAATPT